MLKLSTRQQIALGISLTVLIAATRYHHFGSALHLPDASLAVFFLAGMYLSNVLALPLLLLLAGFIDYLAINVGHVSDWCVTPAYWFLVPAYTSLWIAGRWFAAHHRMAWLTLVPLSVSLLIATSVAFLISNSSFYAFSGYFPDMSIWRYSSEVARYFPAYVGTCFFYVAAVAALHTGSTVLRPLLIQRTRR
jgi:hypothetical protein